MNNNIKTALLAAAASGLFAGATAAHASALSPSGTTAFAVAGKAALGGMSVRADTHSCKGQNSCKGQGGCKSSDNGCKGKNSCKGKGGCATNGQPTGNNCAAKLM